jgi:hypothetical protein
VDQGTIDRAREAISGGDFHDIGCPAEVDGECRCPAGERKAALERIIALVAPTNEDGVLSWSPGDQAYVVPATWRTIRRISGEVDDRMPAQLDPMPKWGVLNHPSTPLIAIERSAIARFMAGRWLCWGAMAQAEAALSKPGRRLFRPN